MDDDERELARIRRVLELGAAIAQERDDERESSAQRAAAEGHLVELAGILSPDAEPKEPA